MDMQETPRHRGLTVALNAPDMNALQDLIVAFPGHLDRPDCIAAVRIDDIACRAEMDICPRPVDPRCLN